MAISKTGVYRWIWWMLTIGGLSLLGLVLWRERFAVSELAKHRWDFRLYGLTVGSILFAEFLSAIRWYIVVGAVAAVPWSVVWRLSLTGVAFNSVVPLAGANSGDMVRMAMIMRGNAPLGFRGLIFSSLVIDRLLGLLGLLLAASIGGIAWVAWTSEVTPMVFTVWLVTALGLLGLLAVSKPLLARFLGYIIRRLPLVRRYQLAVDIAMAKYRTGWTRLMAGLAFSLLGHINNILGIYCIARMLFQSDCPPLALHLMVIPLMLISTALPLPGGAIGVAEEVSAYLFRSIGQSSGGLVMLGYRGARLMAELIAVFLYLVLSVRKYPLFPGNQISDISDPVNEKTSSAEVHP